MLMGEHAQVGCYVRYLSRAPACRNSAARYILLSLPISRMINLLMRFTAFWHCCNSTPTGMQGYEYIHYFSN